eukprot:g31210.t1
MNETQSVIRFKNPEEILIESNLQNPEASFREASSAVLAFFYEEPQLHEALGEARRSHLKWKRPGQPSHQPQEERVPGPFSPSPEDRKGDVSSDEGDFSKPRSQMQVTRRTRPSPKSQPIVKVVVKRLEDFVPRPRPKAAEVWPKHKACAKMQVRSGFRCRGCFRREPSEVPMGEPAARGRRISSGSE